MTGTAMAGGNLDFSIERLGPCRFSSPMSGIRFVGDGERVLFPATIDELKAWPTDVPAMEAAGPRQTIFFDPARLACGIVTCGGLCPGLNDVIRSIVLSLHHHYGVATTYGFRFGFEGLVPHCGHQPMRLTPELVNPIHEFGGSLLGSSRGPQDPAAMVATIRRLEVGILFAIGGDGTLRGAQAIAAEAARQRMTLSVIGVPKTIDNDVSFVQKTFGFETAVTEAQRALSAANAEAEAASNGVGLVKVMGRDSGFIAAYATLADGNVNFCLVPEVPFALEPFLAELRRRLKQRGHAVIIVAEGAGQHLMSGRDERDASGNKKYGDIGAFLRDAIVDVFRRDGFPITVKYIEPSYAIRSVRATAHDSAFCLLLGQNAVHAGMSGRTNMVVSFWNHRFTHVPISLAVSARKQIDPEGLLWSSVLAATGQGNLE